MIISVINNYRFNDCHHRSSETSGLMSLDWINGMMFCESRQYLATSMNDNNLRKAPNLYCGHTHLITDEG